MAFAVAVQTDFASYILDLLSVSAAGFGAGVHALQRNYPPAGAFSDQIIATMS